MTTNYSTLKIGTEVIYSVYDLFHQVKGKVVETGIEVIDPKSKAYCEENGISLVAPFNEVHEFNIIH